MLPYFLINVGQLVFWLRYTGDIGRAGNGQRGDAWEPIMGKLKIFQCNEFFNIGLEIQYK